MDAPAGITVAVTDHAVERFRQRVGSRRGSLDTRPEIASRVSEAWAAGRVTDEPPGAGMPPRARSTCATSSTAACVFVCRHDRASRELLVITLWEDERLGPARVGRRFTDALKADDEIVRDRRDP